MSPYKQLSDSSIAEDIAVRTMAAAAAPDRDALRVLCAHNLSLMFSNQSEPDRLAGAAVPGYSPQEAYSLASRIYRRAQDDWYNRGRCHIGTLALPGALAVGCEDLFGAIAAGYAAMMPVSAAYGLEAHLRGLRPSGLFGPLAACASAGVALSLDAPTMAQALSLAMVTAGGHTQCMLEETDEWRYNVLVAARNGVEAAELAQRGARGARLAFEGEAGLGPALFSDPGARKLRTVIAETPAEGPANVAVKPFAASGVTFAAIFGALEARRRLGGAMPGLYRLSLNSRVLAVPGSLRRSPFATPLGAALSFPALAAEAYLTGTIRIAPKPEALAAQIAELEHRVELAVDDMLGDLDVVVEIAADGRRERFAHSAATAQFPSWDQVRAAPEELALRSEAPVDKVRALIDLLHDNHIRGSDVLALVNG